MRSHFRFRIRVGLEGWVKTYRVLAIGLMGGWMFGSRTVEAQLPYGPGGNLFQDEVIELPKGIHFDQFEIIEEPRKAARAEPSNPEPTKDEQTLLFREGMQLRGKLVSIGKGEIIWRREDADEPLHFRSKDVRTVIFKPREQNFRESWPRTFDPDSQHGKKPAPNFATVKLPGADWLAGELTSTDGKSFVLRNGPEASFEIPREKIEWLYFSPVPASVANFTSSPLELEGWIGAFGVPGVRVKDGLLRIEGGKWISHEVFGPPKFEVDFEVPPGVKDGTRMFLQSGDAPGADVLSVGDIQVTYLARQLLCWIPSNDGEMKTINLPKKVAAERPPFFYRTFVDLPGHRLVVLRGDKLAADVDLGKQASDEPNDWRVRWVLLDHMPGEEDAVVKLSRLRIAPWDGVIPKEGEVEAEGDRLSAGDGKAASGRLEAITRSSLTFSGAEKPHAAETMVRLQKEIGGLDDPEGILFLGDLGQMEMSDLRIEDGRVRGHAAHASTLDFPSKVLDRVAFPEVSSEPSPDVLVFKDGDELPGTLVSASDSGATKWRTPGGKEVCFDAKRLAGVRLGVAKRAAPNPPAGAFELRNGDRVRGSFVSLDEAKLVIEHSLLGTIKIPRAEAWKLYPKKEQSIEDGGSEAAQFFAPDPDEPMSMPALHWICFDGKFATRTSVAKVEMENAANFTAASPGKLDSYEISIDFMHPAGFGSPFGLDLQGLEGDETTCLASCSFDDGQLEFDTNGSPGGDVEKGFEFPEALTKKSPRLNLRAFVNRSAETIDLFLNGLPVGESGHKPTTKLPHIGQKFQVTAYDGPPLVISDFRLAPWSGELPEAGNSPLVALENGDVTHGQVKGMHDGKLQAASEIGELEIPLDSIRAIELGGDYAPAKAAARLRLADGSSVHVKGFRYEDGQVTALSEVLGELHLQSGAVREIVFDPAPPRAPMPLLPKEEAGKIIKEAEKERDEAEKKIEDDAPKIPELERLLRR